MNCLSCHKPIQEAPNYTKRGGRKTKLCSAKCRNRVEGMRRSKVRIERYAALKELGATPQQAHYGSLSTKREAEIRGILKP